MSDTLILVAVIATAAIVCMASVCAFVAWSMVKREEKLPAVLAQSQEVVRMLKSEVRSTNAMLLAHCNQAALIQYQDAMAVMSTQEMAVPGHGEGDPSSNGQVTNRALLHLQAKAAEFERKNRELMDQNRYPGGADGNMLPFDETGS